MIKTHQLKKIRKSLPVSVIAGIAVLAITVNTASAQIPTSPGTPGVARPGVVQYAEPGELSMTVNVWGDVRQPGRWILPRGTDLVELLTVAGGPGLGAEDSRVRRNVILKISRDDGRGLGIVYENDIASIINEGESYPELREGDIVNVETHVRERFGWRDATSIIGTAATLVLLIDRLIVITR